MTLKEVPDSKSEDQEPQMISTKNIENHLQNFCVKMDIQLRDIHPGHNVGKMEFVC